MRMLAEFFPEFAELLGKMDELYTEKRTIDEKTFQFICFALSIRALREVLCAFSKEV